AQRLIRAHCLKRFFNFPSGPVACYDRAGGFSDGWSFRSSPAQRPGNEKRDGYRRSVRPTFARSRRALSGWPRIFHCADETGRSRILCEKGDGNASAEPASRLNVSKQLKSVAELYAEYESQREQGK